MILRFCICIPTFNNPATIEAVIADCLALTPYPVLVVDDGSTQPVVLPKNERVSLLRLEANRGKGIALQQGLKNCLARGFTHMIALDGDGQHLASEVEKLAKISIEHPWDMVIGSRKLLHENVPQVSKFGRKFSNFWVQFQTNTQVSDSQSGFRIYPLFQIQNMKFWTRKFDFEIEVLIRLLWRGVGVREAEIECYYPAPEERVSHFHKFWDNLRISLLNTVLVIVSLLHSHVSPQKIAFAVGTGVWIGCTPLYGFHTIIAGAFAFLFRMNAVYLWLGTQISIPPLAPLIAYLSLRVGHMLTGTSAPTVRSVSWNWVLGSLVLGTVLGMVLGSVSFFVARKLQNQKLKKSATPKAAWNGRSRGGRFGNWFLKTATQYGGRRAGYTILLFVVPYFYFFAPKARRACSEYWNTLEPEKGWVAKQWRIMGHFYVFAQTLLDRIYQGFYEKPVFKICSQGTQNILEVLQSGQGLIMMSAHVGGWDLAAATLRSNGLNGQFHMVQYQSDGATFDKARNQTDPDHVKKLFSNQTDQPILNIRALLAKGAPVGLMGDRPVGNQFELIPLFGKLAPIDCTAFRIAAACGAPLLFTFGFKGVGDEYDFYSTSSKYYRYDRSKDKSLQVLDWGAEFARELENRVRKYPQQWFNFFPIWSTVPLPPEGVEAIKLRNHSKEELDKPHSKKPASGFDPRPTVEPTFQS